VDTSYHHAASESPTFGHSLDPEKAALGGGIPDSDHCPPWDLVRAMKNGRNFKPL